MGNGIGRNQSGERSGIPLIMNNPKLSAISDRACNDLAAFISEAEEKLLASWSIAAAEAQDNDMPRPKFRMAMAITLDLDADKMETALTFGVRHKLSRDGQIPDPAQTELELKVGPTGYEGHAVDEVTISTQGMEPVTITGKQLSKLAKGVTK